MVATWVACLTLVALSSPGRADAVADPVEVTNRIAIDGENPQRIRARASLKVSVPAAGSDLTRYFGSEPGDGLKRLRRQLRTGMGLFDGREEGQIPAWTGLRLPEPAEVALRDGVLRSSSQTGNVDLENAISADLGLWELTAGREDVERGDPRATSDRLVTSIRAGRPTIPIRWVVVVAVRELELSKLSPAPTRLERHDGWAEAEWRFDDAGSAVVEAVTALPWDYAVARDVQRSWPTWLLVGLSLLVTSALIPITAALRVSRGPETLALLVSLLVLGVASVFPYARTVGLAETEDLRTLIWDVLVVLAPANAAAAVGAWLLIRGGLRRWIAVGAAACAVLLLAGAVSVDAWRPFVDRGPSAETPRLTIDDDLGGWSASIAGLGGLGLLIFILTAGVARVARDPVIELVKAARKKPARGWLPWTLDWGLPLLVAASFVAASALVADDQTLSGASWQFAARNVVLPSVPALLDGVIDLLPVALAPVLLAVLLIGPRSSTADGTLPRAGALWLIALAYLFYVVGPGGSAFGVPAPVTLLIAAALLAALLAIGRWWIGTLVPPRDGRSSPDSEELAARPNELIDRVLLADWLARRRHSEERKLARGEDGPGFSATRQEIDRLAKRHAFAVKGPAAGDGHSMSADDRALVTIALPGRPRLRTLALGLGPYASWQENGLSALRVGFKLSLILLAYLLFVLARDDLAFLWSPRYAGEGLRLLNSVAYALTFWCVAACALGCLYARLPSGTGGLKGAFLALTYGIANAAADLLPGVASSQDWVPRAVQLFAFLVIVGVLMDLKSVELRNLSWQRLPQLYQIRNLRAAAVNLAPLVLAGFAIYQQIKAGDSAGAVEEFTRGVPSQLAGLDPDGP